MDAAATVQVVSAALSSTHVVAPSSEQSIVAPSTSLQDSHMTTVTPSTGSVQWKKLSVTQSSSTPPESKQTSSIDGSEPVECCQKGLMASRTTPALQPDVIGSVIHVSASTESGSLKMMTNSLPSTPETVSLEVSRDKSVLTVSFWY